MKSINLLVVDDEKDMFLSTKMALDLLKYQDIDVHVDYSDSAENAIKKLAEEDYEMVLLDIVMERLESGFDVINHIRKKNRRTGIYIRSGLPNQLPSTMDIDGYLNKTQCSMETLHEIVKSYIKEE